MMMPMTVLLWEVVLRSWERIGYAFGMEWWIAKAAEKLFPGKRSGPKRKMKWYEVRRLDPSGYLHNPEWQNIRYANHERHEDSRLGLYLNAVGLLFYPFAFVGTLLAYQSKKKEGRNNIRTKALTLGIIDTILFTVFIVVSSILIF
jgi:hypothetical protein